MNTQDTIHLLRECDAGSKMAVTSIDEVLEKVSDSNMKCILSDNKKQHEILGNEIHSLLLKYDSDEKEPSAMARSMSWLKTEVKMGMKNSDATAADLITDGCHMGIKSLHRYQNQYAAADESAKKLCNRLITLEEDLCKDLQSYL